MDRVNFIFNRNGHTRLVSPAQAKLLNRIGLGVVEDHSMEYRPAVTKVIVPESPMQSFVAGDGLDEMSKEDLHALAKSRGLTLHHMLGADKVRAALREV